MSEPRLQRAVSAFDLEQARDLRRSVLCGELDWPREAVLDPQDDSAAEVWLAWLQDKPVATARLALRDSQASLEALAVLPLYRRQGLGRQLILHLAALAKTQGQTQLLALSPESPAAFFQSMKFEARESRETWTLWALALL